MHVLITPVFVYLLAKWMAFERKPVRTSIWRYWAWIAAAVAIQLLATVLSLVIGGKVGNLILHGVGGGVVATFIFFYLTHTFNVRVVWRVELVLLFVFASTLGVLNELAEYLGQLTTPLIFSADIHDTWRDFVANSTGAILSWALIRPLIDARSTRKKQG